MSHLEGKKVLLFIPNGKGIYGTGVSTELEKRGAKVVVYDERPSSSTFTKILIRLAKSQVEKLLDKYFDAILENHKSENFDYVFIIRGEAFSEKIVRRYREAFSKAEFFLYLWDSLVYTNTKSLFPFFDKAFSYDSQDVISNPKLIFRPLFYLHNYKEIASTKPDSLDVLFIGTVHSDRYSFIKSLENFFKENDLRTYFYFYFPSRLLFLQKKVTDPSFRKSKMYDFNYKHLHVNEIARYMACGKVSLDVQSPLQKGLTMRTIEVLGSKRKLITTNRSIMDYDFYTPQNILVVDRKNPIIDLDFILTPYIDIDPVIYNRYSIEGWIDEIFCDPTLNPYLKHNNN